jgi:hypothetical protein
VVEGDRSEWREIGFVRVEEDELRESGRRCYAVAQEKTKEKEKKNSCHVWEFFKKIKNK